MKFSSLLTRGLLFYQSIFGNMAATFKHIETNVTSTRELDTTSSAPVHRSQNVDQNFYYNDSSYKGMTIDFNFNPGNASIEDDYNITEEASSSIQTTTAVMSTTVSQSTTDTTIAVSQSTTETTIAVSPKTVYQSTEKFIENDPNPNPRRTKLKSVFCNNRGFRDEFDRKIIYNRVHVATMHPHDGKIIKNSYFSNNAVFHAPAKGNYNAYIHVPANVSEKNAQSYADALAHKSGIPIFTYLRVDCPGQGMCTKDIIIDGFRYAICYEQGCFRYGSKGSCHSTSRNPVNLPEGFMISKWQPYVTYTWADRAGGFNGYPTVTERRTNISANDKIISSDAPVSVMIVFNKAPLIIVAILVSSELN